MLCCKRRNKFNIYLHNMCKKHVLCITSIHQNLKSNFWIFFKAHRINFLFNYEKPKKQRGKSEFTENFCVLMLLFWRLCIWFCFEIRMRIHTYLGVRNKKLNQKPHIIFLVIVKLITNYRKAKFPDKFRESNNIIPILT